MHALDLSVALVNSLFLSVPLCFNACPSGLSALSSWFAHRECKCKCRCKCRCTRANTNATLQCLPSSFGVVYGGDALHDVQPQAAELAFNWLLFGAAARERLKQVG